MPRFIYLYKGEATDPSAMSQEQRDAEMERWGAWMGKLGPALLDGGAPFAGGTSVVDDGTTAPTAPLTGYTIVEADDLDAAVAFTDGHPFLRDATGEFAIDVFELIEMDAA